MRAFSEDSKFTVRSVPEIFELVTTLVARYKTKGFGLDDRKLSREMLVNSLFLYFDSLEPAAQREVLELGMARLVKVLSDGETEPTQDEVSGPARVDVEVKDVTRPASAKKKRG